MPLVISKKTGGELPRIADALRRLANLRPRITARRAGRYPIVNRSDAAKSASDIARRFIENAATRSAS